jgi:hypothetical protein
MRLLLTGTGFMMREAEFADAAFIDAVFASFKATAHDPSGLAGRRTFMC